MRLEFLEAYSRLNNPTDKNFRKELVFSCSRLFFLNAFVGVSAKFGNFSRIARATPIKCSGFASLLKRDLHKNHFIFFITNLY